MYSIFHKLIFKCAKYFSKSEKKIKDNLNKNISTHLSSLSPIDIIEDTDYLKTLRWAIEKDGITNIALSGPYGSGKSSIIKAFEKEYNWVKNYSFLNISLATFKEKESILDEDKNDTAKKTDVEAIVNTTDIEEIEKSILQQMFYSVKGEDIPNSRFKRIKSINNKGLKTFLLSIWIISIIELYAPFSIIYYFTSPIDLTNYFIGFFTLGLIVFLYYFISNTSSIKLQKLSLQAPEIDFSNDKSNISMLNEHIDEIIYFFEVTNYNIVVIEDLDRFENPGIFIKLREINVLLNNSKQIKNKNIVFIYAIRDNMFINKERTKFFDFIIPVIPVINFSNSYTKLKKKFNSANLLTEIDDSFLKEISLYIDDMRFLSNVFNEYIQYKNRLSQEIQLEPTKLFAMIIYKNWKPSDFAKLHIKDGIIYKIFTKEYINNKINDISINLREKIISLKNKIESLENEKFNTTEELKSFYITQWIKKLNLFSDFQLDNQWVSLEVILNDNNMFTKLKNQTSIRYKDVRNSWGSEHVTFKNIEEEINPEFSFDERLDFIKDKINNTEQNLNEEINQIEKEIREIKLLTIKELINKYSKEAILEKELLEDDVLSFLVRYGHIDEFYKKYISYFYDGDETIEDNNFLLNLKKDALPLGFDLKLSNFQELLKWLKDEDYTKNAILNYSLINHMFESQGNKKHIDSIIQVLHKNEQANDFILEYCQKYKESAKKFINVYSGINKKFWNKFAESSTNEQKDELIITLIEVLEIEELCDINSEHDLKNYIDSSKNILKIFHTVNNLELFIEVMIKLNVTFEDVSIFLGNEDLLNAIYINSLYKISIVNLVYIISREMNQNITISKRALNDFSSAESLAKIGNFMEQNIQEGFQRKNYTQVQESGLKELLDYINKNISEYINNVFLELGDNKESQESLLFFINHTELNNEQKIKILKFAHVKIDNLDMVNDEYVKLVFKSNKFTNSWANIFRVFLLCNIEMKEDIIEYLTSTTTCQNICETSLFDNEKETSHQLANDFAYYIGTLKLNYKSYTILLDKLIPYMEAYEKIEYKIFGKEKIEYLISNKLIALNNANFEKIKSTSHEQSIKLLECFPLDITMFFVEFINDYKTFLSIIKSSFFSFGNKIEIINYYLLNGGNTDSSDIYKHIFDAAIDYPDNITQDTYIKLIESKQLTMKNKIELFHKYENLNLNLINKTIDSLGPTFILLKSTNGGHDMFRKTAHNEMLLAKLDKLNYISSQTINNNGIRANYYKSRKELTI